MTKVTGKKNKKRGRPKKEDNPQVNRLVNANEDQTENYCDKCGAYFATEYELDHHDKTEH